MRKKRDELKSSDLNFLYYLAGYEPPADETPTPLQTPYERMGEAMNNLRESVWATIEPPLVRACEWLERLLERIS